MKATQAQAILNTYQDLENNIITKDNIDHAYDQLPIHIDIAGQQQKIMAIKRYVIMNFEDLHYTLGNSDIIIDELIEELENEKTMPTELINEQSEPQVDNNVVETIPDIPDKKKRVIKRKPKAKKK